MNRLQKTILLVLAIIALLIAVGCGSSNGGKPVTVGQSPIDPSGNWKMSFTDANSNNFILSGLFSQTGSVVTGISFSETGNLAPGFTCLAQRDISMANGQVQNVNQFSGDLSGLFGTVHFTSTLNDAGTHTSGTYTVTPPQSGNCLGVALTGSFTGDEVPSMSASWTGTVNCTSACPVGSTSGTIAMSLKQDDATGAITGSYSATGLPNLTSGTVFVDQFSFLSGASWQGAMQDQNGRNYAIAGGPFQGPTFHNAGVAQDKTFTGIIQERSPSPTGPPIVPLGSQYNITMSH
jgi:hypothetical protein